MKRHTLFISLLSLAVIVLFVSVIALSHQSTKAATLEGFSVTLSCADFTSTFGTLYLDRQNTVSYDEAYFYHVFDGAGKVVARYPDSGVFQQPLGDTQGYGGVTLAYNIAMPDYNPLTYQFVSAAGMGEGDEIVYSASGECAGLPYVGQEPPPSHGNSQGNGQGNSQNTPARLAPGRSGQSNAGGIPSTAVVGQFAQDTILYFAPRGDASTEVSMKAGQTLWVYGVDASGQFYQVVMGGRPLWVPISSMGPNNDSTWNGKPLPTNVVG